MYLSKLTECEKIIIVWYVSSTDEVMAGGLPATHAGRTVMIALRRAGMKYTPKRFSSCPAADRRADVLKALGRLGPEDLKDLQLNSPELAELTDALNGVKELVRIRKQELYDAQTEHPHDYDMLSKR